MKPLIILLLVSFILSSSAKASTFSQCNNLLVQWSKTYNAKHYKQAKSIMATIRHHCIKDRKTKSTIKKHKK